MPPTRIGGCGCCTGFGHDQIGSKSTCLPWYSASSSVQIAFIASIRSRIRPKRVSGSVPWLRISSRFQPAPTPNSKRPPERWSTEATSLAVVIGSRSIDEADAGADPQRLGGRRGRRAAPRTGRACASSAAAARRRAGRRRFAAGRDVRVLGEQQRLEAARPRPRGPARPGRSRSRSGRSSGRIHARASRRCGVTIRCRSPYCRANACAARLRKQATPSSTPSASSEVICTSGSPQAITVVERRQVVVDVDGEAVHRHPARHVDADRGDLAVLDPHAGVVAPIARGGGHAGFAQRG